MPKPRKLTKAVYLSFNNTSNTTTTISIPFKVSSIHVKSMGYDCGTTPAAGNASYGILSSDLTDYQPLGVFYNDSTYSYSTYQDIVLELYTPKVIQGTFTFSLLDVEGAPYTPVGGGLDRICLILEFNEFIDEF